VFRTRPVSAILSCTHFPAHAWTVHYVTHYVSMFMQLFRSSVQYSSVQQTAILMHVLNNQQCHQTVKKWKTCAAMPTDVGAEMSCATGPGILPSMSESAAILAEMTATHKKHDAQSTVRKCDELCMSIRADIRSNPELAKVGVEHLTKLKCLFTVLQDKPDVPRLPPKDNKEPVNKKL